MIPENDVIRRDFEVEILDKYTKKFLFWERYYFSVRFVDDVKPRYRDMHTGRATWVNFKIGDTAVLSMWRHGDGFWYPQR